MLIFTVIVFKNSATAPKLQLNPSVNQFVLLVSSEYSWQLDNHRNIPRL